MGQIVSPGNVINIDLSKNAEDQVKDYHKRLRTYINKSRRLYTIREGNTDADVDSFMDLYHDNMRRVNAKSKYFFEPEYFYKLLGSKAFDVDLLMAMDNKTGETVAGALFIKKNKIVQYHLSGAREDYLKLNPIKLIIDEMRIRASADGFRYFNLGGGVANKEDSLFQFKQSFSNDVRPFNVWRYVVDRKVYAQLVREKVSGHCILASASCQDFFPCYRCDTPMLKKSIHK